jgi:UDP-glucose 4-epimerase
MMRVLVTGGSGYIGGRLLQRMSADSGVTVTVATRRPCTINLPGVRTLTVDWAADDSICNACRDQDVVMHLAAMNEPDSERDPKGALWSNGFATLALLEGARVSNVRRFVYASTSKVFGANLAGVIDERSVPRPASNYAITHRVAEDYVLAAHDKNEVEGMVLRLSNGLGAPANPKTNAWMLIANDLCRQAAGNQIVLRSSGLAWRNFIAMADVISALQHALDMPREKLADGLFHLGGTQSMRIWDLAARIATRAELLFGRPIATERTAPAPGEQHALLDWRIDKFVSTGWRPVASINDEIDATLRICRDYFPPAT